MDIKSLNLDNGIIVKQIIDDPKLANFYSRELCLKNTFIFPRNNNYFVFYNNRIRNKLQIKRICNDMYDNLYQGFERKLCAEYNDLFLKFNDGECNFYINKERLSNIQQQGSRMVFYFTGGKPIGIENIIEGTIDV